MSKAASCGWLVLLAGFSLFGCAGGMSASRGAWPWEYDGDYGKAKTGNYIGVSGAVAQFGDAPAAAKTATSESIKIRGLNEKDSVPDPAPAKAALPLEPGAAKPKSVYDFTVRDVKNVPPRYVPGGSVDTAHDITAVNHGMAPVSVVVQIDEERSENLKIDKDVPLYAVIPPNTDVVLFRARPQQRGAYCRVSYKFSWAIGVYTAEHRCPEGYRFPFNGKVKAHASLGDSDKTPLYDRFAITFTMPVGTTILAARKGTVTRIKDNNTIDILHDDSTIATYKHMGEIAREITEGKVVSAGDPLGLVGAMGSDKKGYLWFVVWRPEQKRSEGEASNGPFLGFTSVSFPVEFCTDSGQCTSLTQSQSVPGPAPAKAKPRGRRNS